MQVLTAARIAAIDAPCPEVRDPADYEEDACPAGGIRRAQRLHQAYRDVEADGPGAAGLDGQLVDAACPKLTEGVLARHVAVTNSLTP